jgi:hypothetical protein
MDVQARQLDLQGVAEDRQPARRRQVADLAERRVHR